MPDPTMPPLQPSAEQPEHPSAIPAQERIDMVARLLLWCEEQHVAAQHADIRFALGIPTPGCVQVCCANPSASAS